MNKLCTYVMTNDTGLAPNPFWGWCTLAVCTPNHQGIRLERGDWIAGFRKKGGIRLIHAMQVDERIRMDMYFDDPRFQAKKPRVGGTWKERCGDNFYSLGADGCTWIQHATHFHKGEACRQQDTRRPHVFVSKRFWYFGKDERDVPREHHVVVPNRGCWVHCHKPQTVEHFVRWIEGLSRPRKFQPGDSEKDTVGC